jgi:hypothetical protein
VADDGEVAHVSILSQNVTSSPAVVV